MNATLNDITSSRPWWSVRLELLATLVLLVALLLAILVQPAIVDQGLSIAGL